MLANAITTTTAIATGVVAGTAVLALALNVWTGYLAKRSAEAAERSAEAARDAAAATRAAVEVDFAIDALVGTGEGTIRVESKGASVWVHEVRLTSLWDATGFNLRDDVCPFELPEQPPAFVHRGNAFICRWPDPLPQVEFSAGFDLVYSFDRDRSRYTIGRQAKGRVLVAKDGPTNDGGA